MLERLESPLDCKEIQLVNPKGDQSWVFIGRTDAEAGNSNTLATWCKELTQQKDPDAGKDWRWEEKGTTEDEMVGWHHWLDGHEFEQALWGGDGQGSLACCRLWGRKELDMTGQVNWTEWKFTRGNSLLAQWLGHHTPKCRRGPGLSPCQETRSHKPQLRVHMQ